MKKKNILEVQPFLTNYFWTQEVAKVLTAIISHRLRGNNLGFPCCMVTNKA